MLHETSRFRVCGFILHVTLIKPSVISTLLYLIHQVAGYGPPPLGLIKKESQPGWVRFCVGEKHFDVFANQCPAGFFWKPGFKYENQNWDCICTRGPWKRSKKWCGNEDVPRFTEKDLTCFEPEAGSNLEGMEYLGDTHSAWDSGPPYLLTSYSSGFPLTGKDFDMTWTPSKTFKNTAGVIVSRPRDDWTVHNRNDPQIRLCLRAPPPSFEESLDGLFIYNVSLLFSKGSLAASRLVFSRTCFTWSKNDGNRWYEVDGESLDDKNMVVPRFSNSSASAACQRCMTVPIPSPPRADVYGKLLKQKEKLTMEDLKNVAVLTSEINLQTERMGEYWANRLLSDEPDYVQDNIQEFEILNKAAILALGACDMNHIPKEFYQYFLIMLKKLLSESFKKYAPAAPINPDYFMRIQELLDRCKDRTKPIEFQLDKRCPPRFKGYKSANGSILPIPPTNNYDAQPAKHDYLLEFVWRVKSFLHYNCFPEFQEDSLLHDLIQNQLEALFTEDVLLRWFNPSNAFIMYEQAFKMHFDLISVMSNFEKCVRVVHAESQFPVWLKRPIDQPHRTHLSFLTVRRKRRSAVDVDSLLSGTGVDILTLDSEYADMVMENVRQKRKDILTLDSDYADMVMENVRQKRKRKRTGLQPDDDDGDAINEDAEESDDETVLGEVEEEEADGTKRNGLRKRSKGSSASDNSKKLSGKGALDNNLDDSSEFFYADSSEGGERIPDKSDGPWNKFLMKGEKQFSGACIESMSKFIQTAKKDTNSCW